MRVGGDLYGMSCRHVFEKALDDADTRVVPPAQGDHRARTADRLDSRQSLRGNLLLCSKKDKRTKNDVTHVSLTFERSGVSNNQKRVTMDWCVFGRVPEGKNFHSVPTFGMDRLVVIQKLAMIEGEH